MSTTGVLRWSPDRQVVVTIRFPRHSIGQPLVRLPRGIRAKCAGDRHPSAMMLRASSWRLGWTRPRRWVLLSIRTSGPSPTMPLELPRIPAATWLWVPRGPSGSWPSPGPLIPRMPARKPPAPSGSGSPLRSPCWAPPIVTSTRHRQRSLARCAIAGGTPDRTPSRMPTLGPARRWLSRWHPGTRCGSQHSARRMPCASPPEAGPCACLPNPPGLPTVRTSEPPPTRATGLRAERRMTRVRTSAPRCQIQWGWTTPTWWSRPVSSGPTLSPRSCASASGLMNSRTRPGQTPSASRPWICDDHRLRPTTLSTIHTRPWTGKASAMSLPVSTCQCTNCAGTGQSSPTSRPFRRWALLPSRGAPRPRAQPRPPAHRPRAQDEPDKNAATLLRSDPHLRRRPHPDQSPIERRGSRARSVVASRSSLWPPSSSPE